MSNYGMNQREIDQAINAGQIVANGQVIQVGRRFEIIPSETIRGVFVSAGSPNGKTFKTGRDPDDGDDLAPIRQPAPKCPEED